MSINIPARPTTVGPSREVISRAAAIMAAGIFGLSGLLLVSAGAALPLALLVVTGQGLEVPSADLALARQLAPMWPVIAAAGVASFVAAFGILGASILGKRIAIVVAGIGVSLATVAEVALFANGASAGVAASVATTWMVALIATVVVEPR